MENIEGVEKTEGGSEKKDGILNRGDVVERQAREKEENKQRILGLMESGNEPLTNNHVEQMLGISDATATRYLEELEREGLVRQVGGVGRGVYYEKNK